MFVSGQKKNFRYHLSGVVVDLLGDSAHIWRIILPVYHQPSKKAGFFICPWVKNEPPVGPQQSQIGDIESSFFFWPTGTSNDVCHKSCIFNKRFLRPLSPPPPSVSPDPLAQTQFYVRMFVFIINVPNTQQC